MRMHAHKSPFHYALPESQLGLVAQAHVVDSIRQVGADAWNACFPGELEDYHYLLAVEEAGIRGFEWHYAVIEENGRVLAAMPFFLTDYALDTTLDEGGLRRSLRTIRRHFPRFLVMRLACLGSPELECGIAGFHPCVPETQKSVLLSQLLSGFEHYALSHGGRLLGIKDIPERQKILWDVAAPDYSAVPGMATAHLDIDFDSIDEYLARLSYQSRKDMRRKLKNAGNIRIEERTNIDDVLPEVFKLYRDTKERSEFQFEELTEDYFRGVLAQMPGRAFCTLYWHENRLLACNLMVKDEHKLLDKFFCMNGREGREHNLYFLSWFHNLQYCLDHGIPHYQSGQACYDNKLRLKSRLQPNWMLFRHSNPFIDTLLKLIAPLLAMDEEET